MERIIFDAFVFDKENDKWFSSREKEYKDFIEKRQQPYEWLYKHNLLTENCYDHINTPSGTQMFFVMPAGVIEKHKDAMIADGVDAEVIELAISKIAPCVFCGTVSLTSTYVDYRDVDGCVSRYHSCDFCKGFYTESLYEYKEQAKGDPIEFAKIILNLHRDGWAKKAQKTA